MEVVYIDSVFLFNALTDYLLLLCAARLAGRPLRRLRFALAAALGGVYAAAVFFPGCGFLTAFPVKLAAGVLLCLVAFGGEEGLGRLTALFFAVSCGFAGCALALGLLTGVSPLAGGIFYTRIDGRVLAISAAAAYLVLGVVFRRGAAHGGELVTVKLTLEGREAHLTALCDTGNTLQDPVTGQQVLVAEASRLRQLWPEDWRPYLTEEGLRDPARAAERIASRRLRLLPYRAVGVRGGLLLAVRCDAVSVDGMPVDALLVALSPSPVSDGGGYHALWGGHVKKGVRHEVHSSAEAVAAAVAEPSGKGHVYRWQRYAAAAAEPGRGSSTVGAPRNPGGTPDAY